MNFEDTIHNIAKSLTEEHIKEQFETNEEFKDNVKSLIKEYTEYDYLKTMVRNFVIYSDEYRELVADLAKQELSKVKIKLEI